MFPKRHQDYWKQRPNNASLFANPTQADIQNVYSFCQNYNDFLSEFVFNTIEMTKNIKLSDNPIIIDTQENLVMVIEILKQQRFVFLESITQNKLSYKGYISWLIIATYNQLYVIDVAKLHDQCHLLKQVLQNKNLIKFTHECQEVLFSLKRDFSIFMPNIFDIQVIQRYLIKKGKLKIQSKLIFKDFINSLNFHMIASRPIKQTLQNQIQHYYQREMVFLTNLDKFFSTEDPEYQCYAYFNNYELLLKSYFHHVPSVQQIDELQKMKHGVTRNMFSNYRPYQKKEQSIKKQSNQYWIKDKQEQELANLLCEWREHIAKIHDVNSQQVIPYQIVSILLKTNVNSILQVSQFCSNPYKALAYSLSLQQLEQVFQLFQLYKEQKQEQKHQLMIPRRLPYFKVNQEKPIKQLFQELKFTDPNNDWLNKKNDQAVKLYKQIVSITEFDSSIVQEYLKQINYEDHKLQHLKIEDINKFIKYAEYLRIGNHKQLQELYERNKNKHNKSNSDIFQQNFIQGQYEGKNWDQIENQINFPTMDTINNVRSTDSLTSIKTFSNLDVQSCKILFNPHSLSILKQNKLNSLNQIDSPSFFQKIQALPENIEAIYLDAAKAKKNYTTKGQKKNTKGAKKQSKTKIQGSVKKQEEFIPRKEDIFNLIHY